MALSDDLERWESDVVLADGGTVHVRPIRPRDRDRLVAMHARLSPQSIYYRYFSPKPRPTDKELERFTTVDFVDRVALVALLGDDLIAVARYDRWPGKDEAEVAFTVDDSHQGRGISTVLLEHLAAIARDRGIVRFTAEVLPDNRPMLGVFRRAGFEVSNAFSGGIIDVAFDIDATPAFLESVERREQRAESRSIARLLRPRSVAVIGASDRPESVGRAVLRNLLGGGFDGPIYPVNPTAPHVLSVPAYASVVDIPDDIHLAVVAVPPAAVRDVIEQCAAKRVRGVVVITTGFSDQSREGLAEEREMVELGRRNGMRLIGPASMGVIANGARSSLHATFASAPVLRGTIAISLQSGPLGAGMLELAARMDVGISSFVSLGNKGDVSANDLMNHWEDDPDTTVICLYTETFGNPHKFGRIARRVSRRKPIVAVKANRSGGDDTAADALYQQAGVIRVDTVREMFNVARILSCQPLPVGGRVAVVANAASPAVLALDGLLASGLEPADLAPATKAALAEQLVPEATVGRAIDLTYRAGAEHYSAALSAVLADEGADAVLAIYAPPIVNAREAVALAITDAAAGSAKPVVAVVLGDDRGLLVPGGKIPVFEFPEPAVAALGRGVRYSAWRARPLGEVKPLDGVDGVLAREVVERGLRARPEGTLLPLRDAQTLLGSFGIPFAPARAVTSLEDALAAGDELGF